MYPLLRLGRWMLGADRAPRAGLLETTCVRLRIWPNDLDLNFHVNNGRYATLADIARLNWFRRTGVAAAAARRGTVPVVGDLIARFRRDMKLFDVCEIHTRLLGWDARWGFIEHRYVRGGRVIGVVAVRGVFTGAEGALPPAVLLADVDPAAVSPPLPAWARHFDAASQACSELLREEERAQGLRG